MWQTIFQSDLFEESSFGISMNLEILYPALHLTDQKGFWQVLWDYMILILLQALKSPTSTI